MPDTIDRTLDVLAERYDMALPMGDLFYGSAEKALLSDAARRLRRSVHPDPSLLGGPLDRDPGGLDGWLIATRHADATRSYRYGPRGILSAEPLVFVRHTI